MRILILPAMVLLMPFALSLGVAALKQRFDLPCRQSACRTQLAQAQQSPSAPALGGLAERRHRRHCGHHIAIGAAIDARQAPSP